MADGATENAEYGRHSVWRIDRFDLIFYNARHKRWQFFAEDPTAPATASGLRIQEEGLHRFQIRSLLGTFRTAVRSVWSSLSKNTQELFEFRSYDSEGDIELTAPASYDFWKDHKSTYLEYLIRTAWHDGVPDNHRRTLQDWFNGKLDKVPRSSALTFLSLLPILDEWDTWGCFIRARNHSKSPADSFPPAEASIWTDPFYVAELDFSKLTNYPSTPSHQVLGYTVEIEGWCGNIAEGSPTLHRTSRADFFDSRYCKRPEQETELLPYKFYSALVDPILGRVAGSSGNLRQFVIAYPVNVAGRLHFLQIALSRDSLSQTSVDALWGNWRAVHDALWTAGFRTFLREELQRIGLSAFQSEVHSHLKERIQFGNPVGEKESVAELYPHVYHLFPVRATRTEDGAGYAYRKYLFPETQVMLVGDRWEKTSLDKSDCDGCKPIDVDGASIFVPTLLSSDLDRLAEEHRVRHSIEQQKEFLKWLPKGLEKAREDAEEARRRAKRIVEQWRRKKEWQAPTLQDLSEMPPVEKNDAPAGREPFPGRHGPLSLRRYVAQAFNITDDEDTKMLDALRSVTRPSLVRQLSEYFETGPAKLASHPTPSQYFTGNNVEELRKVMDSYYDPLSREILERIASDVALGGAVKCTPSLTKFHERLLESLKEAYDLESVFDDESDRGKELINDHRAIRVNELGGISQNFRCYWLDPMKVLAPCLAMLAVSGKYLGHGLYAQRLSEPYPEIWVPTTGFPKVRCLEHFICFGSQDEIPINAFSNGNVCQMWQRPQQHVAELFVQNMNSTHVLSRNELAETSPQVQFVEAPQLHAQLGRDKITSQLFEEGAEACVVMRLQVWRTVDSKEAESEWTDVDNGNSRFEISTISTLRGVS